MRGRETDGGIGKLKRIFDSFKLEVVNQTKNGIHTHKGGVKTKQLYSLPEINDCHYKK